MWCPKLIPENHCQRERNKWPQKISNNIKVFYETFLKQNSSKINAEKQEFHKTLNSKTLTNQQPDLCKNEIWETDLFDSIRSMKNKTDCINKRILQNFLGWAKNSYNWKY